MKFRVEVICYQNKDQFKLMSKSGKTLWIEMPMFARSSTYANALFAFLETNLDIGEAERSDWLKNHKVAVSLTAGHAIVAMKTCFNPPSGFEWSKKTLKDSLKTQLRDTLRPSVIVRRLVLAAGVGVVISTGVLLKWSRDKADLIFKLQPERFSLSFSWTTNISGYSLLPFSHPVYAQFEMLPRNLRGFFRLEMELRFSFVKQTGLVLLLSFNPEHKKEPIILHQREITDFINHVFRYFTPTHLAVLTSSFEAPWQHALERQAFLYEPHWTPTSPQRLFFHGRSSFFIHYIVCSKKCAEPDWPSEFVFLTLE
jgi:hypothetical protein